MSLVRLVFPDLSYGELWHVLNFLTIRELHALGSTCRSAFITFMRELQLRKGQRDRQIDRDRDRGRQTERESQTDMDSNKEKYIDVNADSSSYRDRQSHNDSQSRSLIDDARFLSKYSAHDKVLLVSYPRSGNSYVRKLLELSTGVVTGSDSRPNRTLSASLLRFGYKGEGVTDQSVWVVKSHYPERLGYLRVPVKKVIMIVRNPFDAIESYFHMGMTNTHDKVLSAKAFESLRTLWDQFIPNEAVVWTTFHKFWLEKANKVPMIIVRYEDMLKDEAGWMRKITAFLNDHNPPQGYERFVPRCLGEEQSGPGYKPKPRKIGKALSKMGVQQAKDVLSRTEPLFSNFGYTVQPTKGVHLGCDNTADKVMTLEVISYSQELHTSKPGQGIVVANDTIGVRDPEDRFGRKITETRQHFTNGDKTPFETD